MDPITFEIIRHRLFRVIEEGVITLKHVSGSEITCEGHDLMVALHRADGSLLIAGIGYLHHTPSAAEACKHIVRRFAGEIDEDDVFLLNDPYTAAHHTSDIYLISPIHYEGRLVAWSSSFVHVNDIGATNPGGFCPDATEIYVEGFSSPGIKLIEKGKLRQDLMDTICNMVRSPALVTLDLKSMIACHNVAKERMHSLYDKYGSATVDEACGALIEQSDQRFGQRLEELPDGQWQSRQRLHCRGEDYLVALTMTKKGGHLTFDFSGTSTQSQYAINSPYWATWGAIFSPIFSVLCPDMVWNEGLTRRVTMVAPEGSIINFQTPSADLGIDDRHRADGQLVVAALHLQDAGDQRAARTLRHRGVGRWLQRGLHVRPRSARPVHDRLHDPMYSAAPAARANLRRRRRRGR